MRRTPLCSVRSWPDPAQDFGADPFLVDAKAVNDLGRNAFALADDPEQQVLGPQIAMAQSLGFSNRELKCPLGPRRQPHLPCDGRRTAPDDRLDRHADVDEPNAHTFQHPGGNAVALAHEPEQQVLGADVVVTEPAGFVLREFNGSASAIREEIEGASTAAAIGGGSADGPELTDQATRQMHGGFPFRPDDGAGPTVCIPSLRRRERPGWTTGADLAARPPDPAARRG